MLKSYGAQFDIQGVLAILLVIVLVSIGSNVLVGALGRRFVRTAGLCFRVFAAESRL